MRRAKSLRNSVYHANGVVWKPVRGERALRIILANSFTVMTSSPSSSISRMIVSMPFATPPTFPKFASPRPRRSLVMTFAVPARAYDAEGRGSIVQSDVGVEFTGVRSGFERRRGRVLKAREGLAERDERRERKSLRNEVHNANAVVWGPV